MRVIEREDSIPCILFLLWGHLLRALQLQVGAGVLLGLSPSSLCEILVRVFVCFLSHST
jgi:hypothetical protein